MKTLIVEDDHISSMMILGMLAPLGECVLASNGLEAMSDLSRKQIKGLCLTWYVWT